MEKRDLTKTQNNTKRMLVMLIISVLFVQLISGILSFFVDYTQAATRSNYTSLDESKYPGYNVELSKLKAAYPNATIKIIYTGLDWNEVLKNENLGHGGSPRSLVTKAKTGEWICPICGDSQYDNGSWRCASQATIGYYMDPRNWVNTDRIFQFEEVKYVANAHNLNGIKSMTNGTFLAGDQTAQDILTASQNANLSPYYIVSRIIQEQGRGGSSTGTGNYSGYVGWYNVFNISATGNDKDTIIRNALEYAKGQGWNSVGKSIIGGINYLKSKYVDNDQDSIYLQKFNVAPKGNNLYSHQYMQNIQAPYSESKTVYDVYKDKSGLNGSFTFLIPVYENMPSGKSPEPSSSSYSPINVQTTGVNVNVRSGPGTGNSIVGNSGAKGTILLSIERVQGSDNLVWHKVFLSNGTIGYIRYDYLLKIADVTTRSELVVANKNTELRNGPGTSGTKVTSQIGKGTIMTRIDKNNYNKGWDRVILSNGIQGFIPSDALTLTSDTDLDIVRVTGDNVRLRSGQGTSYSEILKFNSGELLTRLEKGTTEVNGHYWDKVINSDGVTGYVARTYLTDVTQSNGVKIDGNYIKLEPGALVKHIKKQSGFESAVAKTVAGGVIGDTDAIGTGCTVTANNKTYTVIKMGDVNGDGLVKAGDYVLIKNHIMNVNKLNEIQLKAADVNKDGDVKAADYVMIKNYIMNGTPINI